MKQLSTYKLLTLTVIMAVLLISCKEDQSASRFQELEYYKISTDNNNVVLNNIGVLISEDGNIDAIPITLIRNGKEVIISSTEDWCHAELIEDASGGRLKITADTNLEGIRSARVKATVGEGADMTSLVVYVKQEATLTITPKAIFAEQPTKTYTLDVKSISAWTAESDADWCTIATPSGNATITITTKGNESLEPRVATLTFSTATYETSVRVTQASMTAWDTFVDMVYIEGGTFRMGVGGTAEHLITLDSYHISRYEITQEQWNSIMDTNDSPVVGDKLPVQKMSWNEIQTFITVLNLKSGKNFRLPTEAEWEFASRGGNESKGYKWSGSNTALDVAWHNKNAEGKPHEVGTLQPNELGLYDMSGNMYECVNDWYAADYGTGTAHATNPQGPTTGAKRVIKGGSFTNAEGSVVADRRGSEGPDVKGNNIGFRLAW